jgi:sialate O-acetylesterase
VTFHHFGKELQTSDSSAVRGFSIDKKTELEAVLRKAQVELFTKTKPEFIYYGWQPFSTANLVNSENLPTSTFKLKVK